MEVPGDGLDVKATASETLGGSCGEPPQMATHFYIDDRVRYIREFLASRGVDFDRPCTHDADGDCWLSGDLTPWNKILAPACVELIELEPTVLSIRSIDVDCTVEPGVDVLHDAAYLFTWLPKQHACVQSICLIEHLMFRKPAYVFRLALGGSARLRHLTLKGGYSTPFSDRDMSEGLNSLTALESFEFLKLDIVCHRLARDIATLLRRNGSHLVKVRFQRNALSQRSTAVILNAVLKCQVLSELSFDHNHLNRANMAAVAALVRSLQNLKKLSLCYSIDEDAPFGPIAEALRSNTSLEELRLHASYMSFAPLFEALETNTTLRLLDMDSCTLPDTAVAGLARALRFNRGLRSVLLQHCSLNDDHIVRLASAIAANKTLEKLDLLNNRNGARGVTAFCQALRYNCTLRSVGFGLSMASNQERRDLSQLLNQTECYGRIALPWDDVDLTPLTIAVAVDSQSPQELDFSDTDELSSSLLRSLFDALACNTVVKSLKLEARHYDFDKAAALSTALILNRSITSLELHLGMNSFEGSILVDVCKALIKNATLVKLTIFAREISLRASKVFVEMLRANRTLTAITFFSRHFETKRLEMLSRGMTENKLVTSFTFVNTLPRNRATFRIREALRRNVCLLNMAVKFVTRTTLTKRCAQAFETLRGTSSLVFHVSKATGKSEQEAVAAIEAADRYIRSHYLCLTGIVKYSVKCYPSAQTQADALNDYCWQAIAEFLMVSDVLDK